MCHLLPLGFCSTHPGASLKLGTHCRDSAAAEAPAPYGQHPMADTERAELIPEHLHSSSMGRALKANKAWKWPLRIHIDPRILSASAVVGILQRALDSCCGNVESTLSPSAGIRSRVAWTEGTIETSCRDLIPAGPPCALSPESVGTS